MFKFFKKPKSKKIIRKQIHAAIAELILELDITPSLEQKQRMEKALYSLYGAALDSNASIDELSQKDTEITPELLVDALNRVHFFETKLREELLKHVVIKEQDSGVLSVYIEQALEPIARLGRLLSDKVNSQ